MKTLKFQIRKWLGIHSFIIAIDTKLTNLKASVASDVDKLNLDQCEHELRTLDLESKVAKLENAKVAVMPKKAVRAK
jgi:hypothetical protein